MSLLIFPASSYILPMRGAAICRAPTIFFSFFWFGIHKLEYRVQPKRTTGGDAVLGKHEGSPARRHSRNSCHMFVYIVVCACSRHARDFKIRLFRSFVSRKGYCMTKSRRSESIHTYDNTQKICTPEFPILSNLRFCRLCQRGS